MSRRRKPVLLPLRQGTKRDPVRAPVGEQRRSL
jgi:hypothetical protein